MHKSPPSVSFLIIGAAKAGTTSLASWLDAHPDICMSSPKETMFFGSPRLFEKGLPFFHANFFSHYAGEQLIGDATPAYSDRDRHPNTPSRVHCLNSNAKIIYIARHPLRKVESSWQMLTNLSEDMASTPEELLYSRRARMGFASFIQDPALFQHFVSVCRYQYQINAWRDYFPDSQIHIMFLEDLARDRNTQVSRLCSFLGVDPSPLIESSLKIANTLSDRRTARAYVSRIVKSGLHRYFPVSFRRALLSTTFFSISHHTVLKPVWPKTVVARFKEEVAPDVAEFLRSNGKKHDFYDLDLLSD